MRHKKLEIVSQNLKDVLMGVGVNLNGKRARIIGRLNPYATVCTEDHTESAQWSWESVRRIVAAGGEFKT